MLDVILYGFDCEGRLTLQERSFRSMPALARFLRTISANTWEWAEVQVPAPGRCRQVIRYSADELRSVVEMLELDRCEN